MSGQGYAAVPNWLVDSTEFTAHDKLVYMVLARHVDEYGAAFPGIKSIAARTGLSESSIKRAKKRLLDAGLIEIISSRRHERGARDKDAVTTDVLKVNTSRPRPSSSTGSRSRGPVDKSPRGRGQADPRVGGRGQADPRAGVPVTSGLGSEGPPNNPRGTTPDEGRGRVGEITSPARPVDNFPPRRPLARADRCAVHQDDLIPPPCGACKDARLTLELVQADLAARPRAECGEHGYPAASCPHCEGGRLFELEGA